MPKTSRGQATYKQMIYGGFGLKVTGCDDCAEGLSVLSDDESGLNPQLSAFVCLVFRKKLLVFHGL